MMRIVWRVVAYILALAMITANAQTITEYQLKAGFVNRFPHFVEWPSLTGADPNVPVVIGILGEDPFGRDMEDARDEKSANHRRVIIKRFSNLRSLTPCHILFICSSQKNNVRQILDAVAGWEVLTVGETDRFAEAGGVIQMKIIGGKADLTINLRAAERAKVRIGAQLLKISHLIKG